MLKYSLLLALLFSLANCKQATPDFSLSEGDFIFQNLDCGPQCDAIEEVTEGVFGLDFSHVGIVVRINGQLMVLEAISKGVVCTPLTDFIQRVDYTSNDSLLVLGRLKPEWNHLIPHAVRAGLEQLGTAYDNHFLMNNGAYYCSELLHDIFKEANNGKSVFKLYPMTFKPIADSNYYPVWVEHFNNLGEEIPETEPGLNPGSISKSDKLEIILPVDWQKMLD